MQLLEYGKIAIYFSFSALIISAVLFIICVLGNNRRRWLDRLARGTLFSALTASCISFFILVQLTLHKDYSSWYVWQHVSNDLEGAFLLSSIWEGQEGSFLLWIFFQSLIGLFLLTFFKLKNGTLLTFSILTAFLVSFVLGWQFNPESIIGSSPFYSVAEKANWPILKINSGFIPTDGNGMNLLLRNYWMIIHPPVIFFSFALLLIPFCMAVNPEKTENEALLKNGVLLSFLFLTLGIFMGAYWAYETLNFGGYWNWDPVENAIYVPWLLLLGSFHFSIKALNKSQQRFNTLIAISYWAVLYSTFLTRSGVLGDSSVHSFTGSGLYNQFVVLLIFMLVYISGILVYKNKQLKQTTDSQFTFKQSVIYFLILVLGLGAFQVILPTSFPVLNNIFSLLGKTTRLAAPSDPISFYTNFQMGIGIVLIILLISAYGIKNDKVNYKKLLKILPFSILVCYCGYLMLNIEHNWILLFYFFLTYAALLFSWEIIQIVNWKRSASLLAHLGFTISIVGILISSAKNNVLTKEEKQLANGELTEVENQLIKRNESIKVGIYTVGFKGVFLKYRDQYVPEEWLSKTNQPNVFLVRKAYSSDGLKLEAGKFINVSSADFFYKLSVYNAFADYERIIYPRVQMNADMGGVVASPSIISEFINDLYIHVSNFPDPSKRNNWSQVHEVTINDSTNYAGFQFKVLSNEPTEQVPGYPLQRNEQAEKTVLSVVGHSDSLPKQYITYEVISPEGDRRILSDYSFDQSLRIGVRSNLEMDNKTLLLSSSPNDWVVVRVIHFPWVFLIWLGGILMVLSLSLLFVIRVWSVFGIRWKTEFHKLEGIKFSLKEKLLSNENKF